MSVKDNGGPAFPRPSSEPIGDAIAWDQTGMSLRDWFAGKAMQVEISTACHSLKNAQALVGAAEKARRTVEQQIAHNAYCMADAMIAERERES